MRKRMAILMIAILFLFTGCSPSNNEQKKYEGRTFYEIFVRAFNDSNGDGSGDLKGVTEKLDYLQELGIKGIWLMPITKSTSYHGYDTEDYYSIDEDYGTIDDLKELTAEAKKRDIKVVMDLVVNHTSLEHPWFKEARENPNSEFRDYYVWTNDMSKENETSKMGTKGWSKNGDKNELYFSIFWSGMPDLNMDNPKVREEVKKVAKFYLDLGIDGFRLDAVKWVYDETEKNLEFWADFDKYVKSVNKDAVLVGEVWDKPSLIKEYATVLDSFFEFEIGKEITNKVNKRSLKYIVENFNKWNDMYLEQDSDFIISNFLTNHDQTRAMNLVSGNEDLAKVAAAIYLNLPGTPYIYYGEETGMTGKKPDERIREPFIWSSTDKSLNAKWIDSTNDIEKVALDIQMKEEDSIYNVYKSLINLKNERPSLRYGTVSEIENDAKGVLIMERVYKKEKTLVIVSVSEQEETITLDNGYTVLYSNKGKEINSKLTNQIRLNEGEILILK